MKCWEDAVAIALDLKPLVTWTDERFGALCRANPDWNFELTAAGELIVVAPVGGLGGTNEASIIGQLWNWDADGKLGKVFSSQTVFSLPNGAKRMPDAAWVKLERWEALAPEEQRGYVPLAPDFAVEVRSPTDDLETLQVKMREYVDAGVRLGWLIDPQQRRVEIYREGDRPVEVLDAPDELSGEGVLPGLSFSTARLF
ncbi:MAG: Uma2 family endonuclease [Cyanobacteria bacterium J06639_1]